MVALSWKLRDNLLYNLLGIMGGIGQSSESATTRSNSASVTVIRESALIHAVHALRIRFLIAGEAFASL